jgi:hypothetical protein
MALLHIVFDHACSTCMVLTHIFVSVFTQRSEIIELPADEE